MKKLLGLVLLAAGCSSAPTQVIVTIDAQPGVQVDSSRLRVAVLGGNGRETAPSASRFEQTLTPGASDPPYPFTVALAPLDGDVGRSFSVTATAETAAGGFVGQARVIGGYVEGETLRVTITLEDACRAVMCGAEQTCKAGACVDAHEVSLPTPSDAGPGDAGQDSGERDAGAGDAGPRDAGPRDAGPPDAGGDAGGSCPAFIPGTWRLDYSNSSRGFNPACRPGIVYGSETRSATILMDLHVACPVGSTCVATDTPCTSRRDWTADGGVFSRTYTLETGTVAHGVKEGATCDGAGIDILAQRIGP